MATARAKLPRPAAAKKPARPRRLEEVVPATPSSARHLDALDDDIARRVILAATPELAGYLQEHLGQKLTGYLAGLKDTKNVGQWAKGTSEPPAITRERLRAAFHATHLFLTAYDDHAVQGWFFGANSSLDNRAPAAVLREAQTPDEMALIAPLAHAFVRAGH
jgi:hypothetical protein